VAELDKDDQNLSDPKLRLIALRSNCAKAGESGGLNENGGISALLKDEARKRKKQADTNAGLQ
jgi:hypothetical protein